MYFIFWEMYSQHWQLLSPAAAGEFYRSAVSGVDGIGYEHLVALVEEGHADVHQALFRTDQGVDLRLPVEIHSVELLVPVL